MDSLLRQIGVVPVVVIERAEAAASVAQALCSGGLPIIEVTLRTPAALDAISHIAANVPDAIVGAGTVLNEAQVDRAHEAGARFFVSPGLYEPVVAAARAKACSVFPGVQTASEVQAAWNLGLKTLKFFPAGNAGGVGTLRALGSVFRDVGFMPTGGVSAANLGEYLRLPSVIACGGSWLTPSSAVAAGDFESIASLAREARRIAAEARA